MAQTEAPIPQDDAERALTVTRPSAGDVRHIALVGDIYSILITGEQTYGRYCLIDMRIPPGGGPPPHRHDFEEMFTLLDGELEFTFRDEVVRVRAGETVNIPANAPHCFRNVSENPTRTLCMCTPAGQEEYFLQLGDPVPSADSTPPRLTEAEQLVRQNKATDLAARYRTEML